MHACMTLAGFFGGLSLSAGAEVFIHQGTTILMWYELAMYV